MEDALRTFQIVDEQGTVRGGAIGEAVGRVEGGYCCDTRPKFKCASSPLGNTSFSGQSPERGVAEANDNPRTIYVNLRCKAAVSLRDRKQGISTVNLHRSAGVGAAWSDEELVDVVDNYPSFPVRVAWWPFMAYVRQITRITPDASLAQAAVEQLAACPGERAATLYFVGSRCFPHHPQRGIGIALFNPPLRGHPAMISLASSALSR